MNEEMLRFSANLKSKRERCDGSSFFFEAVRAVLCFLHRDLIKSSRGTRKITEKEKTLIRKFFK